MSVVTREVGAARRAVKWRAWILLLLAVLAVLVVVAVPVFTIHPFKSQSARGLEWSYRLKSWSPLITLIGSAFVLVLVIWLWRRTRWWSKPVLGIALLVTLLMAWFSRQNHFEWMFNALSDPAYVTATKADFVGDGDMVLAVENNGDAVAYPIRQMAYHHVVHDVVGGMPIAATY